MTFSQQLLKQGICGKLYSYLDTINVIGFIYANKKVNQKLQMCEIST